LNLRLPLYQTGEGELHSLSLNYIYFPIEKPQECFRPLFKQLLYNLWLAGVFSYHHENNLYLAFQVPSKNLLEEINRQLNTFIEKHVECFPKDFINRVYQEKELSFADSIMMTKLHPSKSHKDFIIVRSIVYRCIQKIYGYGKGIVSKESIIYVREVSENEDRHIFENKFIRQGIKFMFEITPRGRGRIWFDIVTHAFKVDELGRTRRLSHPEMRQESLEFYRKYLSLAQAEPKLRYSKLMEMLNTLNIQDSVIVKYYVWNSNKQQFEEYVIKFMKQLDKLT